MTSGRQIDATILVVEDDDDHAELIARALGACASGPSFVRAENGEQALELVTRAERGDHPEIAAVLLDLRLPKMDGLELLRRLKSTDRARHVPVIVLTSSSAPSDVRAAYERHANSYLVKPIDFSDLRQLMSDFVRYWVDHNVLPTGAPGV
jgi:two-component system response regulator